MVIFSLFPKMPPMLPFLLKQFKTSHYLFFPLNYKGEIPFPLTFVIGLFSHLLYNDPPLKCHLAYLVFSDTCWSSLPSWVRSHSHIQQHAGEIVTRAESYTWLAWRRPWWWKHWLGGWNIQRADYLSFSIVSCCSLCWMCTVSASEWHISILRTLTKDYFLYRSIYRLFSQLVNSLFRQ